MLDTIVVGVDGGDGGRDAIALASRIAAPLGARLLLAHALPSAAALAAAVEPDLEDRMRADAERLLADRRAEAGVEATIEVLEDEGPARALQHLAERERAGLIVVGASRRGLLGRLALGDDTRATLSAAPCAVAIAPVGQAGRARELVTIGIGYDGSPEARSALAIAASLARAAGATLRLVGAVPEPHPLPAPYGVGYEPYIPELMDDLRAQRRTQLDEAVAGLDVEATTEVVDGPARQVLSRLSESVDLLVVGSRGYGPVRRVLLGSTSHHLVEEASCPVLVMPRVADREAGDDAT